MSSRHNYYSQHGEDVLLNKAFGTQKTGFFVEVGCIDGRRFSNTLFLEEKGWKGLCIEAHEGFISALKENRPNSIIEHCAAGEKDDEVSFLAHPRGSLSSVQNTQMQEYINQGRANSDEYEVQQVKMMRLDTIFSKHNITDIDVLSLDIEGYELEALKGLSLDKYMPRIIIVEIEDENSEKIIDNMLMSSGYIKSIKLENNQFYTTDSLCHKRLDGSVIAALLIHTGHPIDNIEDKSVYVIINTIFGRVRYISWFGYWLFKLKRVFK